jgi:hypothetical protein
MVSTVHVDACIKCHGGHFERLLQMYSFSYNSQMKCFLACSYGHFFLVLVYGTRA